MDRLHVLLLGPGLGRKEQQLQDVLNLMHMARDRSLPFVVDADGLYAVTYCTGGLDAVRNYPSAILTPNAIEFDRLREKLVCGFSDRWS